MKKLRLYLDTTIWNYSFAEDTPQRQADTLDFFQRVRMGLYENFYSDIVVREIEATRTPRRHLMEQLIREVAPQMLEANDEIEDLVMEYLEKSVFPKQSRFDAFHVAYATFHHMDALVSWNFRHLANVNRRKRVMVLNIEKGYNFPLDLVTPLEVMGDEKD